MPNAEPRGPQEGQQEVKHGGGGTALNAEARRVAALLLDGGMAAGDADGGRASDDVGRTLDLDAELEDEDEISNLLGPGPGVGTCDAAAGAAYFDLDDVGDGDSADGDESPPPEL